MEDLRFEIGGGTVNQVNADAVETNFIKESGINTIVSTTIKEKKSKDKSNTTLASLTTESPKDNLDIPVGVHCILELYDCPPELLNDIKFIKTALKEAAITAKSTLLDEVAHQFHPQGVTALALLAESHISIHTWPENGYLAADVFTCGEHAKPVDACNFLVEIFQAGNHVLMKLPRGGKFIPNMQAPRVEII